MPPAHDPASVQWFSIAMAFGKSTRSQLPPSHQWVPPIGTMGIPADELQHLSPSAAHMAMLRP